MFTINDCVQSVIEKLANRTGIESKVKDWIKRAVVELSASYKFEELCFTAELKTFTSGLAEYHLEDLIGQGVKDITQIHSWFVYTDTPTNSVGYGLKYRTLQVVEPISKVSGLPAVWTRHGDLVIVGPKPNFAYDFYLRPQKRHPFTEGDVGATTILMPDDWQEIVEYAAAERGAINERMLDYATTYHQILFGDPEFEVSGARGKGKPGLIFRRQSQQERDMSNNERQLQPMVDRY